MASSQASSCTPSLPSLHGAQQQPWKTSDVELFKTISFLTMSHIEVLSSQAASLSLLAATPLLCPLGGRSLTLHLDHSPSTTTTWLPSFAGSARTASCVSDEENQGSVISFNRTSSSFPAPRTVSQTADLFKNMISIFMGGLGCRLMKTNNLKLIYIVKLIYNYFFLNKVE